MDSCLVLLSSKSISIAMTQESCATLNDASVEFN